MRKIEGFRLRKIQGQSVVIGEGSGQVDFNKLIILNDSAAYLWERVEGICFDATLLSSLLVERYGISEEIAHRDAENVVGMWKKAGIIETDCE